MSDAVPGLSIPVIPGSVRRDRVGIRAARLLAGALAARGRPTEPWVGSRLDRLLDEFCWHAHALKRERASGTPY